MFANETVALSSLAQKVVKSRLCVHTDQVFSKVYLIPIDHIGIVDALVFDCSYDPNAMRGGFAGSQ